MKVIISNKLILCFVGFICISLESVNASCQINGNQFQPLGKAKANDNENYFNGCASAIRKQVKVEFEAAMQYLLMGAYFDQDDVNLPGFSRIFFEHADEERQHGMKFIEYLRFRGGDTTSDFLENGKIEPILGKYIWSDGTEALRDALKMEKHVSGNIKNMIDSCDGVGGNDYYSADWLTGTWLDEQLSGQRQLAGHINTLENFRAGHEELADWMFSNQLMKA